MGDTVYILFRDGEVHLVYSDLETVEFDMEMMETIHPTSLWSVESYGVIA